MIRRFEVRCVVSKCHNSLVLEVRGNHELGDLEKLFTDLKTKAGWGDRSHCPDHDCFPWKRN